VVGVVAEMGIDSFLGAQLLFGDVVEEENLFAFVVVAVWVFYSGDEVVAEFFCCEDFVRTGVWIAGWRWDFVEVRAATLGNEAAALRLASTNARFEGGDSHVYFPSRTCAA